MEDFSFKCPYCGHATTITRPNYFSHWERIEIAKHTRGNVGLFSKAITCPNKECGELYLDLSLKKAINLKDYPYWRIGEEVQKWQLLPESEAKVLPEYIPQAIQDDYYEACRIRDLSPKASATLARRCLQGMIRDFWSIKKSRLFDAIQELQKKVDPLVWDAIDAVRSVGNIGAHMEKDINFIIDVDPKEAKLLIGLIEQLVDDWYVNRHEKEERLKKIKIMASNKKNSKNSKKENDVQELG